MSIRWRVPRSAALGADVRRSRPVRTRRAMRWRGSSCARSAGAAGPRGSAAAVEVHPLVDHAGWLGVQKLVGGHAAVADVDQPALVPPARVAGAAGEPEVGPVPANLAGASVNNWVDRPGRG